MVTPAARPGQPANSGLVDLLVAYQGFDRAMERKTVNITRAGKRRTARVKMLPDGSMWKGPLGTPLEAYFAHAYPELVPPVTGDAGNHERTVIAAIVDGNLRELTYSVDSDVEVQAVLLRHSDGLRIYRRSLSFVLIVAAAELFPERKIRIDHSLPFGGYYCAVVEGEPFGEDELSRIKQRMTEIIAADEPITRSALPLDEANQVFEQQGDTDKIRLLKFRSKDYLIVYKLRDMRDYYYGYMVPSTGYLHTFDLTNDANQGFILHYPRRSAPTVIQPVVALPKLRRVFHESARWLDLLGIEDIGALNEGIRAGRARELTLVAEALHESSFADIADAITERPEVRLVLIAGPSSSGKTTSSKRLAVQLMAHGLKPFTLGMDNYFLDREDTPRDEHGDLDFEHLEAVNLDLFNQQLLALMDGETVRLPHYNFLTGKREWGETVTLTPEHILIVEGIHGLNPELVRAIPDERVFRLYVSCLTQLNIDRHNRVPTTDVRLVRRIVRDAAKRGYTALDTLTRWESVRKGERRWVFPYQENADMMFNSALVYELAVLRSLAEPLLLQVEHDSPYHIEAKRMLAFLSWVEPLRDTEMVPDNSILREFIDGGILSNYTPGQPNHNGE
jgi:uridine kinase